MNSDYEQNQQGLLFFMICRLNMILILSRYIYMDYILKGLSIESNNILNGVRTEKI